VAQHSGAGQKSVSHKISANVRPKAGITSLNQNAIGGGLSSCTSGSIRNNRNLQVAKEHFMKRKPDDIDPLTSAATEPEAAMIVGALSRQGIDAVAEGGLTSGLRAEAPGQVRILVRHEDIDRARKVIEEYDQGVTDIDWSQIDVGELES
jgi:hypothetical protein